TIARRATEEALSALAQHHPEADRSALETRYSALIARTPSRSVTALPQGLLTSWQELQEDVERLFYETGKAGLGVRHKATNNGSSSEACTKGFPKKAGAVLPNERPIEHLSPALIVEACPTINDYGRPIRDIADVVGAGRYLRASLGAHESAWNEAVAEIGAVQAAAAVIYVLQLYEDDVATGGSRIRNPGGYFRALVRMIKAQKLNLEVELMT